MSFKRTSITTQISGDELFVPIPHSMIDDRELSHAAVRLWCMLHRLWFRREPPTMECLQDVMGSWVIEKQMVQGAAQVKRWQPATRRSIERWLSELEVASWLTWNRRADVAARYHLHTSGCARTQRHYNHSFDQVANHTDDTITPSHDTTSRSHDAITPSHDTTSGLHDAITPSHDTTSGSHDAITPSYQPAFSGVPVRQNEAAYKERKEERRDQKEPSSPPHPNGGREGPTPTERFLVRAGFSASAAHEFRDLALVDVQREIAQRQAFGQGPGAMVKAWRVEPPTAPEESAALPVEAVARAHGAKQQALQLAPPDTSELEIQYLALALEEGEVPDTALAALRARRVKTLAQVA